MLLIGIDTGTHTGIAVYDTLKRKLIDVNTLPLHRALRLVLSYNKENYLHVVFEDARKRKWIPNSGDPRKEAGRRMGAGAVKRDAAIWEEFLKDEGIPYTAQAPAKGATKWNAELFAKITGWRQRTSEHSRDAALLVFRRDDLSRIDI